MQPKKYIHVIFFVKFCTIFQSTCPKNIGSITFYTSTVLRLPMQEMSIFINRWIGVSVKKRALCASFK